MNLLRLRAAAHELRCWECRVTWVSWFQRLIGLKGNPRLPKWKAAMIERIARLEAEVESRKGRQ